MPRCGLAAIVAVVASGVLLIGACSGAPYASSPDDPDGGAGDSGDESVCKDTTSDPDNCGACGAVCGLGTTCTASKCIPGCRDKVLYVSGESGKDDSDGCTPQKPLRTIGGALARVATQNLVAHEVHVCRGTYAERALRLDRAVTMRGGYDCFTWTRGPEFGAAGGFGDGNDTVVASADYTASAATFDVNGAAVDASVRIEGFTFNGPATGTTSGNALVIRGGAAPLVTDIQVVGGATSSSASIVGSVGIAVQSGAHPEIANSRIKGGSGTAMSPGYGSVGIAIGLASAYVHDTDIDAGSGRGQAGCIGVIIQAGTVTTPTRLERNVVRWGDCAGAAQNAFPAVGIWPLSGDITLEDNRIIGGNTSCTVTGCRSSGVSVGKEAKVRIRRNLVYAGNLMGVGGFATEGIALDGSRATEITGNVIHAGGNASAAGVITIAVDVIQANDTAIIGNSLVFATPASASQRIGLRLIGDPTLMSGPKNTSITGNMFVGALRGAGENGIERWTCSGASVANMHQNVFVSVSNAGRDVATAPNPCDTVTSYALPTTMDTAFGVTGGDDKAVSPGCNDAANCFTNVACADAATCASAVFQAWDEPSSNVINVVGAAGGRLTPTLPCAIAKSAYALPAGIATDLYGTPRTSPISIGAAEQEMCTP